MNGLQKLTVSLTKQNYVNIPDVVMAVPRDQFLNHLSGQIDTAQFKKMLSYDEQTQTFPEEWDAVRERGERSIRAFTFLAVIFSHYKLIDMFVSGKISEMRGVIRREEANAKTYTNLVYFMYRSGLCRQQAGATETFYNFEPLFDDLDLGPLFKPILKHKLEDTGWEEPGEDEHFRRGFYEQCYYFRFHDVLGINEQQFEDWLEGRQVHHEHPPSVRLTQQNASVSANLLTALAAKPFVILTGTTGTGKTLTIRDMTHQLIPHDLEGKEIEPDFNHVFIPVAAGWTDGRHLVGYRTPFGRDGEQYVSTPLISLLLRASYAEYAAIPFFVILDEMNLSHVEMYFARFLSLIETVGHSRIRTNPDVTGTSLTAEPVLGIEDLKLLYRTAVTDPVEATFVQAAIDSGGLFLTSNVFVIGTVNVDETTHMFSPKVLDRAFVLEYKPYKPSDTARFFQLPEEDRAEGSAEDLAALLLEFGDEATLELSIENETELLDFLDDAFDQLGKFRFGPRVTNEARRFFQIAHSKKGKNLLPEIFGTNDKLMDMILCQKLLPKLYGNRGQLSTVVEALTQLARDRGLKASVTKLEAMAVELKNPGFTNFFSAQ